MPGVFFRESEALRAEVGAGAVGRGEAVIVKLSVVEFPKELCM